MNGYVQVYTGNGKGKTTAALGLTMRAVGAGLRVYIGQFIKNSDCSEVTYINENLPNATIVQYGQGFFIKQDPTKEDIQLAEEGLWELHHAMTSGKYDVIIADEANCAVTAKLFPVDKLLELIDKKPDNVELIFTGRGADQQLIDRADLVTEMKMIKHYFDDGVTARKGIEN
jgi:cob(I)alamin adenosyltransferase